MPHLINPMYGLPSTTVLERLEDSLYFLIGRAREAARALGEDAVTPTWGIAAKRALVDLAGAPMTIGKRREGLIEIINLVATVERMRDVIEWFMGQGGNLSVGVCHPTTSSGSEERTEVDLELELNGVRHLIEICDVVSENAGANNKEKKTLKALGCAEAVPNDDVIRLFAASPEWAKGLTSPNRKWSRLHYRYVARADLPRSTVLLRVVSAVHAHE